MDYKQTRQYVEQISNAEKSDIDWIFCHFIGCKRSELDCIKNIEKNVYKNIINSAKKLKKGIPVSQIIGYVDFIDAKILVNKNVLSPRQETEELTALAIDEIKKCDGSHVLDLCTGSGSIAISIAKITNANVVASDISGRALKLAKKNAKLNDVNVKFVKSNFLAKVWGNYNFIICNPPYIDFADSRVDGSVYNHEPHIALYAKDGGYYYYKVLAQKAKYYLVTGGKLYLEVGIDMAKKVATLFQDYAKTEIVKDMQNIERFVIVTK